MILSHPMARNVLTPLLKSGTELGENAGEGIEPATVKLTEKPSEVHRLGAKGLRMLRDLGPRRLVLLLNISAKRHSRGLTVELSGARAEVWAWHFIAHASARAIC